MTDPVRGRPPANDLWWLDIPAADPVGDAAADFDATQASLGYVPNVMLAGANLPGPFLAMRALYRSIMVDADAPLAPAERELIALVVSVENRCDLCVIGHASMLRSLTGNPYNVGVIEVNYRRARLTARERALADFAVEVTRSAAEMEPSRLDPMRAAGLTEQEILAAAHVAAYYNMSNRLVGALGVKSQPEAFHAHRQEAPRRLG